MTRILETKFNAERAAGIEHLIVSTYYRNSENVDREYMDNLVGRIMRDLDSEDAVEGITKTLWINFSGGTTAKNTTQKIVDAWG